MKILGLSVENFMKVRVVEIWPKNRVVQITGKNGQGKTSAMLGAWCGLLGKKMQPEKAVRKGAEKARIQIAMGDAKVELKLTRTIGTDGGQTLTLETAAGDKVTRPQQLLDGLMGAMPGDPLALMKMAPKEQAEVLRKIVKVDCDIDALNAENAADYAARTEVNREVAQLEAQLAAIAVQEGLPKEKLPEAPVREKMATASAENAKTQEKLHAQHLLKEQFNRAVDHQAAAMREVTEHEAAIGRAREELFRLEGILPHLEKEVEKCKEQVAVLAKEFEGLVMRELVNVSALAEELETIQLTNREIDKRTLHAAKSAELADLKRQSVVLTRAMETRNEKKRTALEGATVPIPGMTLEENEILVKGIPLTQLGEAEQLKICALVYMSGNPKMRVLPIWHGEALDDDNLAMLNALCEEHDFQIWMARVDCTGTVGIVMQDGEVKQDNG